MDLSIQKDQNRVSKLSGNPIEEKCKRHSKTNLVSIEFIRDYLTLKQKKIPNKKQGLCGVL
jgi:hypothetical protein